MASDDVDEQRVHPAVPGQFGVEAGGHQVPLADRDDPTVGRSPDDPPEDDDVPSDPEPLAGTVTQSSLTFTLAAARGYGPLRPFARLTLTGPGQPLDPDVRFDAVLHPPPGMVADGPMARLRTTASLIARS